MVWSGSAVLEIAHPGSAVPNDLDMYVPFGAMEAVHEFLSLHTGYVKVVRRDLDEDTEEGGGDYSDLATETGIYPIVVHMSLTYVESKASTRSRFTDTPLPKR